MATDRPGTPAPAQERVREKRIRFLVLVKVIKSLAETKPEGGKVARQCAGKKPPKPQNQKHPKTTTTP